MNTDMDTKTLLAVLKPACLDCKHLVEFGANDEPCRKDDGCPAGRIAIVLGTDMNRMAERLAEAIDQESQSLQEIAAELQSLHPAVRSQIWLQAKGKLNI